MKISPVFTRLFAGLAAVVLVGAGFTTDPGPLTSERPPSVDAVVGLADTAVVGWGPSGTATIRANTTADALAALGYVHGTTRSWVVSVLRRTALGTLSAKYGVGLTQIDRHVRRLGFARQAQATYNRLPPVWQNRLQAYTRGLNAALTKESTKAQDPFVFFGTTPAQWEPWHPLAVERLYAWLATDPVSLRKEGGRSFRAADRKLRQWVHLHGWNRSVAWAARSTSGSGRTTLFSRYVLGDGADPLIQEVSLKQPPNSATLLASLPGGAFFPAGNTGTRAWTYFLSSSLMQERVAVDSTQIRGWYERIDPAGGAEELVHVRRHGNGLIVDTTHVDTARVLHWPGFTRGTDVPRWTAMTNLTDAPPPRTEPFHLLTGNGLTIDSTGSPLVRGSPPVVERTENRVLVGQSNWARSQARGLFAYRPDARIRPRPWSRNDSSAWAARLLPELLSDLAPLGRTDSTLSQALTYLRNWNYTYDPSSIGASLFDRWMRAYRTEIGHLPTPPDTTYFAGPRRRAAFQHAVAHLAAQHGRDVRRWRWEQVAATQRPFLVWSADSLISRDLAPLSTTRYAPLNWAARGHASTLSGGPTLVDPLPLGPAPSTWEGWMTSNQSTLTVRRPRFDPSSFFARPWLSDAPPEPVSVPTREPSETTRLVPAQP